MAQVLQKINWIDLLVVILLLRSSYVGFTKGFGWELFRSIGYLSTALAAIYYYEYISQLIGDYFPALYPFSNLLSFTGLYLAILFIFKFVNLLIEKIIKVETFSGIEKFGGLVLGFLRGTILTSLLLISLVFTPVPYFEKSIQERSYSGQTVIKVAPFLYKKISAVFPALASGQRNESLVKMTGLQEGLLIFHKVK
ncbi:MAG: CvpA family protein [Candidatus Omnitrophica bacterium]|nr:CvpA family protein [Candidatus Omnitrophota bacterium]